MIAQVAWKANFFDAVWSRTSNNPEHEATPFTQPAVLRYIARVISHNDFCSGAFRHPSMPSSGISVVPWFFLNTY